jgi:leucyl/phenylalanyl-tRNA---protein transferase
VIPTADELLAAYASGYFPMAQSRDDPNLYWFHPEQRGVIPLDGFHVPRSLAKTLKKTPFTFTADKAFRDVIRACADRDEDTWINDAIIDLYCQLHDKGFAHSIECWKGRNLAGGLYGVSLGGAFFGESMFSRAANASKAAMVELVSRLRTGGYVLLDTQYVNDHLKQFGVVEIPKEEYLKRLEAALKIRPQNAF